MSEFSRHCKASFEVRANHHYKTVANCSPLAVCVHVYWKGILVQRVGVHTYEFGLNFPRGSGKGEEDLNLRRKWGSIIPTCNTIFKLMVYKQHTDAHGYTKLQSKHLEDIFMIKILKCSTRNKQ